MWSELGQWMVVDGELLQMFRLLDGSRTLAEAAIALAEQTGKPQQLVFAEMEPVLHELQQRGIAGHQPITVPRNPQKALIENITLNLTNKCNLDCSFCYNSGRNTPEIDIDLLMNRLGEGRELYSNRVSFVILGGEPLLHPKRLYQTIDRANKLFPSSLPMVSTNGVLINEHVTRELAARRVEVQVSLDSHLPQVHDSYRGTGTFAAARHGAEMLAEAGVPVILSLVMTKDNIDFLEPYLDMALKIGAVEARFIPLRHIGRGNDYINRAPDLRQALAAMLQLLDRRPDFKPLLRRDYFTIQMTVAALSAQQFSCGIGYKILFIDADGTVYPCPNHVSDEYACGNLSNYPLMDIFRDSAPLNAIRELYHVKNYQGCTVCPYKCWCAGDCRGEVLSMTGNSLSLSPHCAEIKENYIKMLWHMAENGFMKQTQVGYNVCF